MRFPPTESLIDRHHLLIFPASFSLNGEDEQGSGCVRLRFARGSMFLTCGAASRSACKQAKAR